LVDWAISAYEHDARALPPALVVVGPFMRAQARAAFERRAAAMPSLRMLTFEPRMEHLIADAMGVVSMGGYNIFCEILSFDKRALMVPRHTPRLEQTIRAQAAQRLGLARMLAEPEDGVRPDVPTMLAALTALTTQASPSRRAPAGLLDGLDGIIARCSAWFGRATGKPAA
jgi:predicted glycosyltransferase